MPKQQYVTEGTVAFANLKEHDVYNGKSTGKYTLTLTLPESQAEDLRRKGVKVKDYEGTPQRKFTSQYTVDVLDINGEPYNGPVTRGSLVRVLWASGNPNPEHGAPTYMSKVRVVEVAETEAPEEF